jgi:hypothetical protein
MLFEKLEVCLLGASPLAPFDLVPVLLGGLELD